MAVIEEIASTLPDLIRIRRDLHAHPETAFEERRTSDLIAGLLESWGIEVHRGLGKTGVVGRIRAGSGPHIVGLRADMDALPIAEENAFAHRSTTEGKMHACGHDGHTTMLLGAASYLARKRAFDGTVILIFQPAEEHFGGARAMMDDGLFELFPVESVFGMHNWPGMPAGKFGVIAGPMLACVDNFEITIRGQGGHAAMPHESIDPIVIGSALVQSLQTVVSRSVHPLDSGVVSVTQFHAGDTFNVIPESAVLRGTTRSFKPEVRASIAAGMARIAAGIASAYGARIDVNYMQGYPATVNRERETGRALDVLLRLVGKENIVQDLQPTMGGEDFAYMLQEKPGCYVFIGNGPVEGGRALHGARYDFNDEILPLGASYWALLAENLLARA